MGSMGGKGGMLGGGGMGQAREVPEPASYVEDTAKMEEEKSKAQKALLAMKGRQSTILTGESTLSTPEVGKRKLLGA